MQEEEFRKVLENQRLRDLLNGLVDGYTKDTFPDGPMGFKEAGPGDCQDCIDSWNRFAASYNVQRKMGVLIDPGPDAFICEACLDKQTRS